MVGTWKHAIEFWVRFLPHDQTLNPVLYVQAIQEFFVHVFCSGAIMNQ